MEEPHGSLDAKNLMNDSTEKRDGTELIGSNGSDLPEKHGKFTTNGQVRGKRTSWFTGTCSLYSLFATGTCSMDAPR